MSHQESAPGKLALSPQQQNRLVLAVLGIAVSVAGLVALAQSMANNIPTTAQWDAKLAAVIHSDNTQSVVLPSGKTLWVFGDTTQANGTSVVTSKGFPHDSFVLQDAGAMNFHAVPGSYGYGWQQVPNWADGTYFWMSSPVVDHGTLYILGSRIKGESPYKVVGEYAAEFNASTLKFEKMVSVPAGANGQTVWGGIAADSNGWWVSGTHSVSCSLSTDCRAGDFAWVPVGDLGTATMWQVHTDVIPAGTNIGTVVAVTKARHGWVAFSKTGDSFGGTTIERLTAQSVTGTWRAAGAYPAVSPAGSMTYSVAVHPEQAAAAGNVLVSYNVNGISADYHAMFEYLPE